MAWFDTIISPALTITTDGELSVTLGVRSLVYLNAASGFLIYGISATGGNQDGMVVALSNINNGSVSFTALHESTLTSSPLNRLRNHNGNSYVIGVSTPFGSGTGIGTVQYRYFGAFQRWIMMSKT